MNAPADDHWSSVVAEETEHGPSPDLARRLLDGIGDGPVPAGAGATLTRLAQRVVLGHQHALAEPLLELMAASAADGPPPSQVDTAERARLRGLRAHLRTTLDGAEDPDLQPAAAEVLSAADRCLERDDPDRAADLAALALGLLHHVELHSAATDSPLVTSPQDFLRAWASSRVGQLLGGTVRRRPRPGSPDDAAQGDGDRIAVVPGSYPRFVQPVIALLRGRTGVEVVDLSGPVGLRGLGIREELVRWRLRCALGSEEPAPWGDPSPLDRAGAVLVDWADRGSLVATSGLPDGIRLVLRVHSMDAFSPWLQLLDWSRVDDLVLVSEHLRDMVTGILGERLSGTRVHVIPNVVDLTRVGTAKQDGAIRRLVMTGWAQPVKDPLFALEILAELRREDPSWRLLLVGPDFRAAALPSAEAYARAFRQRLTEPDVVDAVEFTGPLDDIAPVLARAGFVLSTSVRESFGLGLVEGAASGAVPVVRDWPVFSPLDGARRLFPDEWVVDDVAGAVRRIRALADDPDHRRAAAGARSFVARRFVAAWPAHRLSDLLTEPRPAV